VTAISPSSTQVRLRTPSRSIQSAIRSPIAAP
jgi:hypothetical protein